MRISDWSSDVCSSDLQTKPVPTRDPWPPGQPSATTRTPDAAARRTVSAEGLAQAADPAADPAQTSSKTAPTAGAAVRIIATARSGPPTRTATSDAARPGHIFQAGRPSGKDKVCHYVTLLLCDGHENKQ